MRQNALQSIITILACTSAVWLTRYIPFWIFPEHKHPPLVVQYLGRALPYASIGMLVVYCLKGVKFASYPYGIPELIAMAFVGALQWWKGNAMVSIGLGTVFYMLLVQFIF